MLYKIFFLHKDYDHLFYWFQSKQFNVIFKKKKIGSLFSKLQKMNMKQHLIFDIFETWKLNMKIFCLRIFMW